MRVRPAWACAWRGLGAGGVCPFPCIRSHQGDSPCFEFLGERWTRIDQAHRLNIDVFIQFDPELNLIKTRSLRFIVSDGVGSVAVDWHVVPDDADCNGIWHSPCIDVQHFVIPFVPNAPKPN